MLTQEEQDLVSQLLLNIVATSPSPRQTLAAGMSLALSVDLGEGLPRELVHQALLLAQNDGFNQTPPAIVFLITALLGEREETRPIIERLNAGPPPPVADPFEALVLNSNLPFLDRTPTRLALRGFLRELRPNKRVVVINGDQSPGKTYTTAFVDHVLADQPKIAQCLVAVTEDQGAAVGPVELSSDLVTNMTNTPTEPPPSNTNQQRWIAEIVNWVLSTANRSPYSWWFILDGFNSRTIRADTQVFIDILASKLGTGLQRDRHRLILLDFDRTVLALPPGSISDQTTDPIPHVSVVRVINQILATSPPELDRGLVTASVLDGFADPVTDLRELGVRLGALIQTHGVAA